MAQDGMYFVSKKDLLQWINSTLDLNITKIEQTSTGAVACQLLDALHPGVVNISKVDFNAKTEYDSVNNYKVLQAAFLKVGVDKPVDVNKLVKGRPLDNMEFMQWFKSYWDSRLGSQHLNYDAVGRRNLAKSGAMKGAGSRPAAGAAATRRAPSESQVSTPVGRQADARRPGVPKENLHAQSTGSTAGGKSAALRPRSNGHDSSVVQELTEQLSELQVTAATHLEEREFYFSKLRDIEVLCQMEEIKGQPLVPFIERVLYASDAPDAQLAMEEARAHFAK
ncbi:Microtubule-associated protein RP/EB family member 3 [Coccomyxa sp. Obi]|nr:Microtubule-associated protein RP/EB family member 3 [Coccomyxa sp. Obi]